MTEANKYASFGIDCEWQFQCKFANCGHGILSHFKRFGEFSERSPKCHLINWYFYVRKSTMDQIIRLRLCVCWRNYIDNLSSSEVSWVYFLGNENPKSPIASLISSHMRNLCAQERRPPTRDWRTFNQFPTKFMRFSREFLCTPDYRINSLTASTDFHLWFTRSFRNVGMSNLFIITNLIEFGYCSVDMYMSI